MLRLSLLLVVLKSALAFNGPLAGRAVLRPTAFDAARATALAHPARRRPCVSMAAVAKQGIFAPLVSGAKAVLGKEELNKLRAKVIAEHSKVISAFVETSDSKFGRIALERMFQFADADNSGDITQDEVAAALKALGFDYLSTDQIAGIFKRADLDENGVIDFEEFVRETPKTLRTNLIKLAKKNGNDLGFLV
jgi:hypothetical protein